MSLEDEVIRAFLNKMREDGRLNELSLSNLEKMLETRTMTKEKLLGLIRTNANIQNKES